MTKFLILMLGFFILSVASDLGRPEECRLELTEWRYWVQILLFVVASILFQALGMASVVTE